MGSMGSESMGSIFVEGCSAGFYESGLVSALRVSWDQVVVDLSTFSSILAYCYFLKVKTNLPRKGKDGLLAQHSRASKAQIGCLADKLVREKKKMGFLHQKVYLSDIVSQATIFGNKECESRETASARGSGCC